MFKKVIAIGISALLLICSGCEDNDIDHRPAAGLGAIGILNNTSSDIDIYIDGNKQTTVEDWKEKAWDLEPGVYRIVINDLDGERSYNDDIDVIVDNLAEVTITTSITNYNKFDIAIVYKD